MPDTQRETWITGIGIVSCLGEGPEIHWRRLNEAPSRPDAQGFAPYIVHPLAPVEFDKQIPKKGDQRQMEPWQRIGTYTAGLALESAGIKGNADLLARTDMIVAAGGGERDTAVDSTILTGMPKAADPDAFLNERLMNDLRPTPDAVPGAIVESPRWQHLDRARRHRLLAHLHGRGGGRHRRRADRAGPHPRRAERDRARRRRAQLRAQGPAGAVRVRRPHPQ